MSTDRALPDLVRDSKIETRVCGSSFQHVFYEAGRSARERQMRREEQWERLTFLGRGAYGTVYLEKCDHSGRAKLRAVKEIKKYIVPEEELDYIRELEAIAKFSNNKYSHCFVRSFGWFEHEDSVYIAMEYLENGDLQRYLTRPLPEVEAKQISAQILEGLNFMHENGFVHRDLKPGNIMVVTKGPDWFVKIADFGISKRRQQGITTLHTLQRGTFGFAAPEALGFVPDSTYTFSVDMWSLGAVTYRILTNNTAFQNVAELFQYINGIQQFPKQEFDANNVTQAAQDFIVDLMSPDPKNRPTAVSAAQHPWVSSQHQSPIASPIDEAPEAEAAEFPPEYEYLSPPQASDIEPTISTASKAWSTIGPQTMLVDRSIRPSKRSNYQPPSVEDCSDEDLGTRFLKNQPPLASEKAPRSSQDSSEERLTPPLFGDEASEHSGEDSSTHDTSDSPQDDTEKPFKARPGPSSTHLRGGRNTGKRPDPDYSSSDDEGGGAQTRHRKGESRFSYRFSLNKDDIGNNKKPRNPKVAQVGQNGPTEGRATPEAPYPPGSPRPRQGGQRQHGSRTPRPGMTSSRSSNIGVAGSSSSSTISATPRPGRTTVRMDPVCAICRKAPGTNSMLDCECEYKALEIAVQQAEERMMDGMKTQIRDWARDRSRVLLLNEYEDFLKKHRMPPGAFGRVADRSSQRLPLLTKAEVDEKWRATLMKYPETLDYYFSLLDLTLPSDDDPTVKDPPLSALSSRRAPIPRRADAGPY